MSVFDQALSRSDFDRCRWEEVVATAPKKDCQEYSSLFLAKVIQARKESDPVADAVFTILFVATNAHLDPDDHDQPFGPRFVHQAARGVAPDDLRDQHYTLLTELAPTVTDPEMKARLCDLVWVRKRLPAGTAAGLPAPLGHVRQATTAWTAPWRPPTS